jgi:antitoxin (DNA-binding transcriptional repressor) of toxin-antitoxin stability system
MKTMSVDEFQKQFSAALESVKKGAPVEITTAANGETVAVLVPPQNGRSQPPRPLGLYAGKLKAEFRDDWAMTDEELLES